MKKISLKFNILCILLVVFLSCNYNHAKDFDINGTTVSINNSVTKKKVYKNTDTLYTDDILASSSNVWEEKDDKVKIKISIQNINPYETLKVKIKEDISPYFRFIAGNINNGVENISIASGTKRDSNYEYKYQKTIFMQDVDHILYNDDVRIDESGIDIRMDETGNDIRFEETEGIRIDESDIDIRLDETVNDVRLEETNRDIRISNDNADIRLNDNNNNIEFKDIHTDIELEEYIKKNNIKIPEGVKDRFRYVNKYVFGNNEDPEIDENIDNGVEYKENAKKANQNREAVKKSSISDTKRNISFYDEKIDRKIENNIRIILLVVIIFVICLVVLFIFYVFMRSYQNKDIDFDKYVGQIVIILAISMLCNIGSKAMASDYIPNIYEYGKTYEKTIYTIVKFDEKYYKFNYIITLEYTNNNEISDYETDTDGDGLVDALEYKYMTDRTKADTDGDGLSDYIEVMLLNYDPNKRDTFRDGRNDGQRDYDNDGLRNVEEIEKGTSLVLRDTDGDGFTDYEELKGVKSKDGSSSYVTNPLLEDTDEDGLGDFVEIKLGLDPTKKRSDNVTLDSDRRINQEYNLKLVPESLKKGDIFISKIASTRSGNVDDDIEITNSYNKNYEKNNFLVSNAFNVSSKETSPIDIILDVSKVVDRASKMVVVKIEGDEISVVDTMLTEDNNIKATIVENGTYSVVDSEILLQDLSIFAKEYID